MEKIAQTGSALYKLYNASMSVPELRNGSWGIWDSVIDGVSPQIKFSQLAHDGKFPRGTKIQNSVKFTSSVNLLHDKLNNLTVNNPDIIGLIGRSRSALLRYSKTPNRQIGKRHSLDELRDEGLKYPEQGGDKYNPLGRANTRTRPVDQRYVLPPLGINVPFPTSPNKPLYSPESHKTGARQKKILRESQDASSASLGQAPALPLDAQRQKFDDMRTNIRQYNIPSPQAFIEYMSNESIPIEKRHEYMANVQRAAEQINRIMEKSYQDIMSMAGTPQIDEQKSQKGIKNAR